MVTKVGYREGEGVIGNGKGEKGERKRRVVPHKDRRNLAAPLHDTITYNFNQQYGLYCTTNYTNNLVFNLKPSTTV